MRNHTAKLNLKAMKKGDRAFFYHSNEGKEIVGVVEVVREAYPDPTAEKGDWVAVDMKAVRPMPKPVTLAAIKADPKFADLALVRQSRLSVVPVSKPHWDRDLPDGRMEALSEDPLVPDPSPSPLLQGQGEN